MSLGLLRMVRWKSESEESDYLIREAKACLEAVR
jgi:hypothetical protein